MNAARIPSTVVYMGQRGCLRYATDKRTALVVAYADADGTSFGLLHQRAIDARGVEKTNMSVNGVFQDVKIYANGTTTAKFGASYCTYNFTFSGKDGSSGGDRAEEKRLNSTPIACAEVRTELEGHADVAGAGEETAGTALVHVTEDDGASSWLAATLQRARWVAPEGRRALACWDVIAQELFEPGEAWSCNKNDITLRGQDNDKPIENNSAEEGTRGTYRSILSNVVLRATAGRLGLSLSPQRLNASPAAYIQDFICHDREEVSVLLRLRVGKRIYVCGTGRIAVGMKQTFVAFMKDKEGGWGALKIFTKMTRDLYAPDLFKNSLSPQDASPSSYGFGFASIIESARGTSHDVTPLVSPAASMPLEPFPNCQCTLSHISICLTRFLSAFPTNRVQDSSPSPPTSLHLDIVLTTSSEPSRPVLSDAVNYFNDCLLREMRILLLAAFTNLCEAEHRRAFTSGKSAAPPWGQPATVTGPEQILATGDALMRLWPGYVTSSSCVLLADHALSHLAHNVPEPKFLELIGIGPDTRPYKKAKAAAIALGIGVTEEGELFDEDGSTHGSTQDTTEDDPDADTTDPPNANYDARSVESPVCAANSSAPHLNGPDTPNPSPEIPGRVAQTRSVAESTQSEARGMTAWAPLQNYNVKRSHSINLAVRMDVHRQTGDPIPNELKVVVMQVCVHSVAAPYPNGFFPPALLPFGHPRRPRRSRRPQQPRLGAVYLNLAEYADAGKVARRCVLRQSKTNATLKLSIELEHIGGEKHYKPPPLRKGEFLASVSGMLSNNRLFNTRFARELDLYVGTDELEDETAFPYADKEGHVKAERLATSYGVRTTEDLLEVLFNPVPSETAEQTPFTYYAPPTSPSERAKTRSPQSFDDNDSSDPHEHGRRSVDSSVGSASVARSTSETSSFDPGMAATMNLNQHSWQKMRSRPRTPASATKTSFRLSMPAPPVPSGVDDRGLR
ncbi:hypothetical protein V8D89_001015 [Ganoderma adspersum]